MAAHCDFIAGVFAGTNLICVISKTFQSYTTQCTYRHKVEYLSLFFLEYFLRCMQHVHITSIGHCKNKYAIGKYEIPSGSPNTVQNRRSTTSNLVNNPAILNVNYYK